jgi:hypothetical protein
MPNVTVNLLEPIEGPGPNKDQVTVQISQIVLREPRFKDVMTLGEPAVYARSEAGMIYQAEKDDVIAAYIERLLVEPKDPALLNQVGLADTLQLKEAVFGFFQTARRATSQPS